MRSLNDPRSLVGAQVEVFFENDDAGNWFPGTVAEYDDSDTSSHEGCPFRVLYDDGEDEWFDFPEKTVRFTEEGIEGINASDDGGRAGPSAAAAAAAAAALPSAGRSIAVSQLNSARN